MIIIALKQKYVSVTMSCNAITHIQLVKPADD